MGSDNLTARKGRPPCLTGPRCRHCGASKASRPRGLCWPCYYTPGVRRLYPRHRKHGYISTTGVREAIGLPEPTAALPGSAAKVQVLAERAEAGVILWHPKDQREATQ